MSSLYVTTAEATDWPTGLDLQNLIPDGTSAQEVAQLGVILQAASSYVEQITLQPLYAQTTTETAQVRPQSNGTLLVRARRFPLATVTAVQWRQGSFDVWNTPAIAHVKVVPPHSYVLDDLNYGAYGQLATQYLTVVTQYVSGSPNAVLTAPVAAGGTSLQVDDATGIVGASTAGALAVPGTALVLYDAATQAQETVTVQSASGSTVTLTAGTQYAHAAGVRASALPPAVSTATIYLAAWMIKERRAGGGTLMGGQVLPANGGVDLQMAEELLRPFRRVI